MYLVCNSVMETSIKHSNVLDLLLYAAISNPKVIYCKSSKHEFTYEQFVFACIKLSKQIKKNNLRNRYVGILLPNSISFLLTYFAVLLSGNIPALLNYLLPNTALEKLLDNLQPSLVISDKELSNYEFLTVKIEDYLDLETSNIEKLDNPCSDYDVGAILFSGGTTGIPKQVNHSHQCILSMVERMEWGWPTKSNEKWLVVAPFTHIYGFLTGVTNPLLRYGTVFIPDAFEPTLIVEKLCSERITVFGGGPPAIYQALLSVDKFEKKLVPKLRVCPGGGAPFPMAVHKIWQDRIGVPIYEGYGMTEIAPISVNTVEKGTKLGSVGKAVPDTRIEIVDIETGKQVLSAGETGEIRVKGPHMMSEYVGNKKETTQTIKDGFIYTGDIGVIDNKGFLSITDRKKDVIFVKGFNVFPREIEEELMSLPNVASVCVVAKQDDRSGETPVAFITPKSQLDVSMLKKHCEETLLPYKVPSDFIVLESLPLTPAKKIDRAALKNKLI